MANAKYNRYGINKKTYDLLFHDQKRKEMNDKFECSKEIFTIETYFEHQQNISDIIALPIKRIIEMYDYHTNYFHIRKKLLGSGYIYQDKNIKFELDKLEKYLKKILKNEDFLVKKEMIWNIKHNKGRRKCYFSSIVIAANLVSSQLVTSLISFEDGTTHLHSYVEYMGYIIDYTKNLIIKKETYDKLLKVKEIGKVPSQEIPDIFNLILENEILNTARFIATFGTEIKNDLEKNKQLLRKPTNTKADFSNVFFC